MRVRDQRVLPAVRANLFGATLTAANLSGAINVMQNQLPCGDDSMKLPLGMTIKECK
jgi:hypothetical protein